MSFKPDGFRKPTYAAGGGSNTQKRPRDYLVEVIDYNLAEHTMIARDVDTGRDIEVYISPEAIARATRKQRQNNDPTRFVGYMIDERMQAKIQPGARVVLEGVIPQRPVQRNGKTFSRFEAQWINSVPDASPEKAFRGIYTLESYGSRVNSVQVWEPRGLDITQNEEDIKAYLGRMDEVVAAHSRGEHAVNLGLQLRALKKVGQDAEGKPQYEVIDTTGAFCWVPAQRNEAGEETSKGHPMDSESAGGLINGYSNYMADAFADKPNEEYRIEVMPFREFRASRQSNKMEIHEKSPLADMAAAETRCSPTDDEVVRGKNWAVNGIVVLSKDQAPVNKGEDWKIRNFVQDLYTNGYRGHVCNLVWAFDGGRVKVDPRLDRTNRPNYAGASAPSQQGAPSGGSAPAPTDSGFDSGFGGAGDVFDTAGDPGADVFGAALAGASAPAPAPAAAPAEAPAAAPAPVAPPTPGANRPGTNAFGARKA